MTAGEEKILSEKVIDAQGQTYHLVLTGRDLGGQYPGMKIYTLQVVSGGNVIACFRTNTYEYPPSSPISASGVIQARSDEWERDLLSDPTRFLEREERAIREPDDLPAHDVLILQGSPRPAGNCSVLATWAQAEADRAERSARVVYLDDLTIRACIGCYQCYNTGTCIFEDDMTEIIRSISHARIIVICTPVFTNTVPGSLKIMIDRCQAYHAEQALTGRKSGKTGLLFSVAGRQGQENFSCITRVIDAFLKNIHIKPVRSVLFDDLDRIGDIRNIPYAEEKVRDAMKKVLKDMDT
ncbi:MAG TPA: flavodoxin family protein [Methanoregulaceae archaeon]|nr:flavodoxin family protein [Methanoregulaceae archaeon]HPW10215.1 flavodoxin family protein [Methanoregulaceae archaeon]HQM55887.1 flavodoxin family protein [Methanoregulaceae archaeon]